MAVAATIAGTLAACSVVNQVLPTVVPPASDTFATWSAEPLPAAAELLAAFHDPVAGCHLGTGNPRLLVTDRRTEWTAAFLVSDATIFGVCFHSTLGGGIGGSDDPLEPSNAPLTYDYQNVHEMEPGVVARVLAGRSPDASRVTIELNDGSSLVASVANGYWLGWWPQNAVAVKVIAFGDSGAELASVAVER